MEKVKNQTAQQETSGIQKRFKTQFAENYTGAPGSINTFPSETIPDQSLTIRQLVQNHSRGINIEINQPTGEYFGVEIPTFYDLTDKDAYRTALMDEKELLEATAQEEAKNAAEAKKTALKLKQAQDAQEKDFLEWKSKQQ